MSEKKEQQQKQMSIVYREPASDKKEGVDYRLHRCSKCTRTLYEYRCAAGPVQWQWNRHMSADNHIYSTLGLNESRKVLCDECASPAQKTQLSERLEWKGYKPCMRARTSKKPSNSEA